MLTALVRWIDPDARKCGVAKSFSIEDVAPLLSPGCKSALRSPSSSEMALMERGRVSTLFISDSLNMLARAQTIVSRLSLPRPHSGHSAAICA